MIFDVRSSSYQVACGWLLYISGVSQWLVVNEISLSLDILFRRYAPFYYLWLEACHNDWSLMRYPYQATVLGDRTRKGFWLPNYTIFLDFQIRIMCSIYNWQASWKPRYVVCHFYLYSFIYIKLSVTWLYYVSEISQN